MCPLKWKHANECWLGTIGETQVVVGKGGGVGVVVGKGEVGVVVGKGS